VAGLRRFRPFAGQQWNREIDPELPFMTLPLDGRVGWKRTVATAFGKRSDFDRAILARRETCCIRVLDEPSNQAGYLAMASPRRLAAILAADVVSYSRLMGEDEEAEPIRRW
jgi:hypothetical protein